MTDKPEKFSYSKLDTYSQCGYKYKLKYVDGHYAFTNSIATEFGTLLHSTEEVILNSLKEDVKLDYVKLKNEFLLSATSLNAKYPTDFKVQDKSGRTYTDKTYYYAQLGIHRLERLLADHPTYTIVGSEIPFEFEYKTHLFKGFIDRVFFDTESNTYIIQDIKSYAVPIDESKLKTPLQFVVYALAVEQMFGCSLDQIKCQYDLPLCDLIQDAGTAGYIARGLKQLDKLFNGIAEQNFKPTPSPLCAWCEYCANSTTAGEDVKYLCPYFMLWTRENKTFKTAYEWAGAENDAAIVEAYTQARVGSK